MTLLFTESVCSAFSSQALSLPNRPDAAPDLHFAKRVIFTTCHSKDKASSGNQLILFCGEKSPPPKLSALANSANL